MSAPTTTAGFQVYPASKIETECALNKLRWFQSPTTGRVLQQLFEVRGKEDGVEYVDFKWRNVPLHEERPPRPTMPPKHRPVG